MTLYFHLLKALFIVNTLSLVVSNNSNQRKFLSGKDFNETLYRKVISDEHLTNEEVLLLKGETLFIEVERSSRYCLAGHNEYRRLHGTRPLQFGDRNMIQMVIKALLRYKYKKTIIDFKPYAVNWLILGGGIGTSGWSGCAPIMEEFYFKESKTYNYGDPPASVGKLKANGHLTQMLWAETTHMACGRIDLFMLCIYNPPGNYIGEFRDNVKPPLKVGR